MITLKVLNSIVLLGTSCVFVKEANMEEKLFDPPPSAVSSRVNSRANRTKVVHVAPPKGIHLFFPTRPRQFYAPWFFLFTNFYFVLGFCDKYNMRQTAHC